MNIRACMLAHMFKMLSEGMTEGNVNGEARNKWEDNFFFFLSYLYRNFRNSWNIFWEAGIWEKEDEIVRDEARFYRAEFR